MKLVIRADDFGYSNAVNEGILDAIFTGLICEVGLMVNLPYVTHGLDILKTNLVQLGLHSNISIGRPISDPKKIPSLVDANGVFHTSKEIRDMEESLLNKDEIKIEIKAQIEAFKLIVGYYPAYVDVHAVLDTNFLNAVEEVASENNCLYIDTPLRNKDINVNHMKCAFAISPADTKKTCEQIENMRQLNFGILVMHPGYVDDVLINSSSLLAERKVEVTSLVNGAIKDIIDKNKIQLIHFQDIK